MRKRFKLPLTIIFLLITSFSIVFVSYYFLDHQTYAMSVVSNYPLTINYNSGEVIDENNYENVLFSISNSGDEDLLYTINFTETFSELEILFELTSSTQTYEGVFETGGITDTVLIKSGETINYTLNIISSNKNFHGEILVIKEITEEMNFSQTVISNNDVSEYSESKIGEVSKTDEGLISLNNESGNIYYFRGNTANNYVDFADLIWRIVSINSDGTVKLVLDSEIDVLEKYYETEYDFYESSSYVALEEWYEDNLFYVDNYIETSAYCPDNSLVDSENIVYGAYNRVVNSKGATLDCVSNVENYKIGLLTIDEIIYAGASVDSENNEFYLINENTENPIYTMTSAQLIGSTYYPFVLSEAGEIIYSEAGTLYKALKPVINIVKDVYVRGDGTIDNPYSLASLK